jgi:hypothetical protein
MRSLLAVMVAARDLRLSITTKSDLVVRDIDLLRRIAAPLSSDLGNAVPSRGAAPCSIPARKARCHAESLDGRDMPWLLTLRPGRW